MLAKNFVQTKLDGEFGTRDITSIWPIVLDPWCSQCVGQVPSSNKIINQLKNQVKQSLQ